VTNEIVTRDVVFLHRVWFSVARFFSSGSHHTRAPMMTEPSVYLGVALWYVDEFAVLDRLRCQCALKFFCHFCLSPQRALRRLRDHHDVVNNEIAVIRIFFERVCENLHEA
jgi:hypothetical protein